MFSRKHILAAIVMFFFLVSAICMLTEDNGQSLLPLSFVYLVIAISIAVWLIKRIGRAGTEE